MILSFKTQISGKDTNFVKKIILGLLRNGEISACYASDKLNTPISHLRASSDKSKIHSLREDKKNRWKLGMKIDFFINVRTKDMFRFAPRMEVVNIQKIEIYNRDYFPMNLHIGEKVIIKKSFPSIPNEVFVKTFMVKVDEKWLSTDEITNLALNDGFDTVEDFFDWFHFDFKGKIIHWTNFKY